MEKLIVKNFAGIDYLEIEPRRLCVFVGPQASGKSVTAKLLYFFRSIWENLYGGWAVQPDIDAAKDHVKEEFRRSFPSSAWGTSGFTISYEVSGQRVTIRRASSRGRPSEGLVLILPEVTDELFARKLHFLEEAAKARGKERELWILGYRSWEMLISSLSELLGDGFFAQQNYVPAGRAFFSNVEANVFSFISRSEGRLDPFLSRFGEVFQYAKRRELRGEGKAEFNSEFCSSMLGGALVVEKDREYVRMPDGRHVAPQVLSSGQQEVLPLVVMLEPDADGSMPPYLSASRRSALYIEEPEAHLFPSAQKVVTERIAQLAQAKSGFASIVLTTHSPYVLTTINTLLMAHRVGSTAVGAARKRVSDIVPSNRWVDSREVSAYAFANGSAEAVFDSSLGLIDAAYLDEVSNSVSATFDKLLDMSVASEGAQ